MKGISSKEGEVVLPFTKDLSCPFLKEDLSCAIYEDRPNICRKFGDETHILMSCPVQKHDGEPRSIEEEIEHEVKVLEYYGQNL